MTFDDLIGIIFPAHERGDYQAGLEALEEYEPQNDDEASDTTFWRACLLSRLDRGDEALAELRAGLNRGFWWGEGMLNDPDLDQARSLPAWDELAAESTARAAAVVPPPDPLYERPSDWHYGGPTLIALHGAGSRAQHAVDRYRPVLNRGVRLIVPNGTEPLGVGRFAWSWTDAEHQLLAQLGELDPIEPPVLLAGYSQGAGIAGHCAWSGAVEAQGLLLIAASLWIRGIPRRNPPVRKIPTYFLTGTDDPAHGDSLEAARSLESAGVPVRLDDRPGHGHAYPDDFADTLLTAVDWLLEVA